MNHDKKLLPGFVQEALGDDSLDASGELEIAEGLAVLGAGLPPLSPPSGSRARLVAEASTRPTSYLPFVPEIARIMDLAPDDIERVLAKFDDGDAWIDAFPRIRVLRLEGGARLAGGECAIVWLDPGAEFPEHRHVGSEVAICLEGEFHDTRGYSYGRGDIAALDPGSEHGFSVDDTGVCVVAVAVSAGGIEVLTPSAQ